MSAWEICLIILTASIATSLFVIVCVDLSRDLNYLINLIITIANVFKRKK